MLEHPNKTNNNSNKAVQCIFLFIKNAGVSQYLYFFFYFTEKVLDNKPTVFKI